MSKHHHRKAILKPLGLLLVISLLFSSARVSRVGPSGPLGVPSGQGAFVSPTAIPPASGTAGSTAPQTGPEVIVGIGPDLSEPLRDVQPSVDTLSRRQLDEAREEEEVLPKAENAAAFALGGFDSSIVQSSPIGNAMPAPVGSFDGISNLSGVLPPDTNGDIGYDPGSGKSYYMQWVNLKYQIWDVTDPSAPISILGPSNGNTLWAGFTALGGVCRDRNDGDPIVLFDHLANRWFASQFALPGPYYQCIAVSTSADPTGTWNRYAFQWSTTKLNDYPKFGVWPDGYYMSVNQFTCPICWAGAGVAVFDRTNMLAGAAATMQMFDVGLVNLNYGGMLPSDLDGPAPAAGTPNYFSEWDNQGWIPGDGADTLRIWNFHVDWTTPPNSTFGLASYAPNQAITTSDVDPYLCASPPQYFPPCIQQPGTSQRLATLADRLMHRMQYRNFGSYQTLVSNHSVDADTFDKAGIHWYELRKSSGAWSMYQQGVYAPDADSRWMGSAAMDGVGNMALGYSVSSTVTYPSVRYTGRLLGDTLGTLPQGEASLVAGAGSQTNSSGRWGDYSMMSVDPQDGCTFWYTQEYYGTTTPAGWKTRIGAFRFPSCEPASPVTAFYPANGATVCSLRPVGVQFLMAGLDPTPQTLMLDAVDVTSPASKWELLTVPERAIYMYIPTTDLDPVLHEASFSYSRGGVPGTVTWNFTVDGTACPSPFGAPEPDGSSPETPGAIGPPSAH